MSINTYLVLFVVVFSVKIKVTMGSGCVGKLSAEAFRNRKHRNSILGHLSVVVFGATGMIGGAVARALIHSHQFTVTVVTRNPTNFLLRRMEREGN